MAVYFKGKLIGSSAGEKAPKTISSSSTSTSLVKTGGSTLTIVDTSTGKVVRQGVTRGGDTGVPSVAPPTQEQVASYVAGGGEVAQPIPQKPSPTGYLVKEQNILTGQTTTRSATLQELVNAGLKPQSAVALQSAVRGELPRTQTLAEQLTQQNKMITAARIEQKPGLNAIYPVKKEINYPSKIDYIVSASMPGKTAYQLEKGKNIYVIPGEPGTKTYEELQFMTSSSRQSAEQAKVTFEDVLTFTPGISTRFFGGVLGLAGKATSPITKPIAKYLLEPKIIKLGKTKIIQTLTKEGEAKLLSSQEVIVKSRLGIPRTFNLTSTGEIKVIDPKKFLEIFKKIPEDKFSPIFNMQGKLPKGYSGVKIGEQTLLLPEKIISPSIKSIGGKPSILKNDLINYFNIIGNKSSKGYSRLKELGEPFVVASESIINTRKIGLIEQGAKKLGFIKPLNFEAQIVKDYEKSLSKSFIKAEEQKGLVFGFVSKRDIGDLSKGTKGGFASGGFVQKQLDLLRLEGNKIKLLTENISNNFVSKSKKELGEYIGVKRIKDFGIKAKESKDFSLTGTKGKLRFIDVKPNEISFSEIKGFKTQDLGVRVGSKQFEVSRVKVEGLPESKILIKKSKLSIFEGETFSPSKVNEKINLLKNQKRVNLKILDEQKVKLLPKDSFVSPSVSDSVLDNVLKKVYSGGKTELSLGEKNLAVNVGLSSVQQLSQKVVPKIVTKSLSDSVKRFGSLSQVGVRAMVGVSGKTYSVSQSLTKPRVETLVKPKVVSVVKPSVFQSFKQFKGIVPISAQKVVSVQSVGEGVGQFFNQPQKVSDLVTPSISQKVVQVPVQRIVQKQGLVFKQIQVQRQALKQFTPFRNIVVPKIRIPIRVPPVVFPINKKPVLSVNQKSLSSKRAFSVVSRVRGKKVVLALGVPRNLAVAIGKKFTGETTARSFKIQQVGFTEKEDIINQDLTQYRTPKIGGRVSREGFTFVEKSKFAIDTPGEVRGLKIGKFTAKLFK